MREAIYKGWLPQALAMGVEYDTFWSLNPFLLQSFYDAFEIKSKCELEMNNTASWLTGMYVLHALGASFGGSHYPKEPIDLHLEKSSNQEKPKQEFNEDAAKFYAFALEWNKQFREKHGKDGGVDGGSK